MSDNWISLIPEDPTFVPDPVAQDEARELLRSFVPAADEVTVETFDRPRFVSCGGNFLGVFCPACGAKIEKAFWHAAMDECYESGRVPMLTLPCCGAVTSLNDLRYEWPMGWTRFELSAMNPNVLRIGEAEIQQLEQALGCKLRQIWIHI